MGPSFETHRWARQSFNQALACLQSGRQLELMSNLVAASPYYHQSLCALAACTQMLGPAVPEVVYYWMSICEVRLAFLTHTAGNADSAQHWLRQALSSAQTAWQCKPSNPWYQLAATQLAIALGEIEQARRFCQPTGNHPHLLQLSRMVQQMSRPEQTSIDILASLIQAVGDFTMPGDELGLGWMGGVEGDVSFRVA